MTVLKFNTIRKNTSETKIKRVRVYAIKDFTSDCILKLTDTAHRKDENNKRGDEIMSQHQRTQTPLPRQ
jgi:alkyl hydroperoxide reductase subunit AhpC